MYHIKKKRKKIHGRLTRKYVSSDPFSMYSVTIMIGWPAKQMITSASSSKSNFYLIMKIQSRTDLIMMEN